ILGNNELGMSDDIVKLGITHLCKILADFLSHHCEVIDYILIFSDKVLAQFGILGGYTMLWLLYSMTYSQAGEYGGRYILKYLYPLVIMLGASAVIRDEEVFLALCIWARRIAFVSAVVVFFVPILQRVVPGVFWYNTALTLHYVTISCISLALYFFYGKDKKDLILAIVFVLPCIMMVHRTGLLAIFTGLAVFCFFKFKWISLPYIAGVLAIGVAIIFYVPAFHEKMFWTEDGKGKK